MPCSICQHPQRQEIDQAFLNGATLAAVSSQFHLSTSSLDRHKAHLRAKVQRDKNRLQLNLQQYGAFWLSRMLSRVERVSKAAEAEGKYKVVLQAANLGLRLLNAINKPDCPFDDQLILAILSSPQWATQSSLLPDDPEIMALVRQSLANSFATPCPDGPPPASAPHPVQPTLPGQTESAHDKNSQQQTGNRKSVFAENRKPKTENCPSRWEKSGKLAGNMDSKPKNLENNQEDALLEKISLLPRHYLAGPVTQPSDRKLAALFRQCDKDDKISPHPLLAEYLYEHYLSADRVASASP
jgi:hypothetical protein